jgi:hypothetical protein
MEHELGDAHRAVRALDLPRLPAAFEDLDGQAFCRRLISPPMRYQMLVARA